MADRPPAAAWLERAIVEIRGHRGRDDAYAAAAACEQVLQCLPPDTPHATHWQVRYWHAEASEAHGRTEVARDALPHLYWLAGPDAVRLAETARLEARILQRTGDMAGAEDAARRAVALAEEAGDADTVANALQSLGTALSLCGRNREALVANQRSLALLRATGTPSPRLITLLNSVAIDLRHLARPEEALALLDEAAQIATQLGYQRSLSITRFNQSSVLIELGELHRAREALTASLALAEALDHTYGLGLTHGKLAHVYMRAGNVRAATAHAEASLRINEQTGNVYARLAAMQELAEVARRAGEPERATALLNDVLELARLAGHATEEVATSIELARCHADADRPDDAVAAAQRGLEGAREQEDADLEALAIEALGAAWEAHGDDATALAVYREGIDLLESWRGRLALGDLAPAVPDRHWATYEGAVRCLVRSSRVDAAFEIQERARARHLLDLLGGRARSEAARGPVDVLRARIRDASVASPGELPALRDELVRVRDVLRREDPKRAELLFPSPHSLADVRRMVGSDRALVTFLWGEQHVYGWWLDSAGLRAAVLGEARGLAEQVDFLHAALTTGTVDWQPAARRAFDAWIAPLGPRPVSEVIAVMDGPLRAIPLEVLLPEGGVPWGATARFRYAPSASALIASRTTSSEPSPRAGSALVVAYSPSNGDPRDLPPLRHAEAEANAVVAAHDPQSARRLVGTEATVAGWLDADPSQYATLHFATHGVAAEDALGEGHLALCGGQLDPATVRGLILSADLVTLSGCRTASGRHRRGEGVLGLAHAFLAAGARAVVATTWRVEDAATAAFMAAFYERVRGDGDPAAALADVKRRWIRAGGRRSHPAFWAPYLCIGGG